MKIAVTYDNGQVFQHFGHTGNFKVYEVADGKVVSSSVVPTDGNGHGALAAFLKNQNIDTLICGGIGGGARTALTEAGIKFFCGTSGDADTRVSDFLAGKLIHNPDFVCNHHHEHHGDCGEDHQGCGGHDHHCGH